MCVIYTPLIFCVAMCLTIGMFCSGVDEHTALLLDVNTGAISTVGVGTAYVCTSSHDPEVCSSGTPLTFKGMIMQRIT